jgi:hypothetical protein
MRRNQLLWIVTVSLSLVLTSVAHAQATSATRIKFLGTTHLKAGPAPARSGRSLVENGIEVETSKQIPGASGEAH